MISFADLLVFLGLTLLGAGLWWWRPWMALTVVGLLLFGLGLFGSLRGK